MFDNVQLRTLPPQMTLDRFESFNAAPTWLVPEAGTWAVVSQAYDGTVNSVPVVPTAVSLVDLPQLGHESFLGLEATVRSATDAGRTGIVFDYYSDLDFKFLVLDFALNQVQLGHSTPSGGWVVDKVAAMTLNATTSYAILLALRGASISVTVAGQLVLSHGYNSALVDGRFGLLTDGTATFDNVRVQTNDAKFNEYQPGTAQVFISDATVGEGGTAVLTITLSQALAETVTVQWTTGPGTALPGSDFTGTSGTVTFLSGETSKQIPVATLQDAIFEGAETFNVTLANPSGGVTISDGLGVVTINDDDTAPAVSVTATNGGEGSGPIIVTFTRTGSTTSALNNVAISVGGAVGDVGAPTAAGGTLVGSTLSFNANSSTVTLTYGIVDDSIVEGPETLTFSVVGGTGYLLGTPGNATATIVDNDSVPLPSVTVAGSNGAEGGSPVTITFTRTGSTAAGLTVKTSRIGTLTLAGSPGADLAPHSVTGGTYDASTGWVTFNIGVSTVVVTFGVVDDSIVEAAETLGFNVLSDPLYALGSPSAVNVTVTDNDVLPSVTVAATNGGEAGGIGRHHLHSDGGHGIATQRQHASWRIGYVRRPHGGRRGCTCRGGRHLQSDVRRRDLRCRLGGGDADLRGRRRRDGRRIRDARVHDSIRQRLCRRFAELGHRHDHRQRRSGAAPEHQRDRDQLIGGRRSGRRDLHPHRIDRRRAEHLGVDCGNHRCRLGRERAGRGRWLWNGSNTVTFDAGSSTVTLTYAVVDDAVVETTEFVSFAITAGSTYTLGSPSSAAGSIADNDTPAGAALWINSTSVTESDNGRPTVYVTLTVTRTGSTAGTSTVHWATANATATSGSDYVSGSGDLTFLAGETTKTIRIEILADKKGEPNETFTIVLSSPGGGLTPTLGTSIGTVTIVDDDNKIMAAGLPTIRSGDLLDPADATAALVRAITAWIAVGGDEVSLSGVTLVIGDLPDRILAETLGSTITIDADAAGWGWNLTPGMTDGTRIELLSVLLHEIGHVLGYEHTTGGLMAGEIEAGRQLWIETGNVVQAAEVGTLVAASRSGSATGAVAAAATASDAVAVVIGPLTAAASSPAVDVATGAVAQVVRVASPNIGLDPIVMSARTTLSGPLGRPLAPALPMLILALGVLVLLRRRRFV